MIWVERDGGLYYISETEPFGYRTKGEVARAKEFDSPDYFYVARVEGKPMGVRLDTMDEAKKYVETVYALTGDKDGTTRTSSSKLYPAGNYSSSQGQGTRQYPQGQSAASFTSAVFRLNSFKA
jgi:hypothetical protein